MVAMFRLPSTFYTMIFDIFLSKFKKIEIIIKFLCLKISILDQKSNSIYYFVLHITY